LLDDDFREDGKGFRGEVEVVVEEHEPRWSRLVWLPVGIEVSLQRGYRGAGQLTSYTTEYSTRYRQLDGALSSTGHTLLSSQQQPHYPPFPAETPYSSAVDSPAERKTAHSDPRTDR
jgi:hypothetical protein